MTITVYPVDAVTGAPSYTGRMLREAQSVFMAGATAARPLGARSGVRPGTSATTVTATSTTWTVGPCAGILDMETAAEAGPYAFAINAPISSATVVAAHATLARVDIVWVRLDDPAESDGSSVPAVVAGYTAGTAASTPVAPATPARCMVLATIQVPPSGGGSPTVIWVAPKAVAAGVLDPAVVGQTLITMGPFSTENTMATAPTVTGDGVKRFKVTASFGGFTGTVPAAIFQFILKCDGTQIRQALGTITANGTIDAKPLVVTHVPAAGARVYTFTAVRVGGTGTGQMIGSATDPIEIIVEQIA